MLTIEQMPSSFPILSLILLPGFGPTSTTPIEYARYEEGIVGRRGGVHGTSRGESAGTVVSKEGVEEDGQGEVEEEV
jgi:hypothetical protein